MTPLAWCLILYTHQQPTIFIEGSNSTNDQVALAYKATISDFMAVCQHKYWSASLKFKGSRVEGDVTRRAEASKEETKPELMLTVFCCLGRNTMRWCHVSGGTGDRLVEFCCGREYVKRSTHKFSPSSDEAEFPNGEAEPGGEAGDTTTKGEFDRDNVGTA